ncbi:MULTISPECIES: NAD-dependent epimerase/dehydratase family protein [Exiguobacterium]|uniref:NAD-dependent epimerase/dehydratase family protein n=1 Tax=Exiguobacterium TaxID=33986 RepID=UPI001BED1D57|nr:NAD-dependent epimerase/dehydratase family protein [Exiguobacterium himgiriensis]MCT4783170.1 NAD-dependent epimerase/dehydratase family protein [Exiguobacterium himgiriensis]
MKERVVIVGVSGFEGFHLARHFLKEGHEVIGLDEQGAGHTSLAKHRLYVLSHPKFRLVQTKRLNGQLLKRVASTYAFQCVILCPSDDHGSEFRYHLVQKWLRTDTTLRDVTFITLNVHGDDDSQVVQVKTNELSGPWEDETGLFTRLIKVIVLGRPPVGMYANTHIQFLYVDDVVKTMYEIMQMAQFENVYGRYDIEPTEMLTSQTAILDVARLLKRPPLVLPDGEMKTSLVMPSIETAIAPPASTTSFYEGLEVYLDWYTTYQKVLEEGIR